MSSNQDNGFDWGNPSGSQSDNEWGTNPFSGWAPSNQAPQQAMAPMGNVGGSGGNGLLIAVIALAAVVVLLLVGALSYFIFSGNSDEANVAATNSTDSGSGGAGDPDPTIVEETVESSVVTTTEVARRAQNFQPGSRWDFCSGSGAPGDLNLVYKEDIYPKETTCGLANSTRNALVEYYQQTGSLNGTVTGWSPKLGRSYQMTCRDMGDYVKCTGGIKATVYVV